MLKSPEQTTDILWVCSQCGVGYYKRPDECECCRSELLEAVETEEPNWKD